MPGILSYRFNLRAFLRLSVVAASALIVTAVILMLVASRAYVQVLFHSGCNGEFVDMSAYGYPGTLIEFTSSDNLALRGWLTTGTQYPDSVIIVLPGHAANAQHAHLNALLLAENGFGTFILEPRFCADRAQPTSTGLLESRDAAGAARALYKLDSVRHIGILGFSAGGTAALLAAADEPLIEAVVAQGGYHTFSSDLLGDGRKKGLYETLQRRAIMFMTRFEDIPVRGRQPVDAIGSISPRPVFLIYGSSEADSGHILFDAAGEPRSLWIIEGADHGTYHLQAPEEYERRIVDFFRTAFP